MPKEPIGVAVISAGMAGRAHAAGYRAAGSVFDASAPYVRPVAIADINDELAEDAASSAANRSTMAADSLRPSSCNHCASSCKRSR